MLITTYPRLTTGATIFRPFGAFFQDRHEDTNSRIENLFCYVIFILFYEGWKPSSHNAGRMPALHDALCVESELPARELNLQFTIRNEECVRRNGECVRQRIVHSQL